MGDIYFGIHAEEKKRKDKFMAWGKGVDLDNLFTVSFWVLIDAEDCFFSREPGSILPCYLFSLF